MSMIIKENTGMHREVEIPQPLSPILTTLGMESKMDRTEAIDILEQGLARTVAQGDTKGYNCLTNAINELNVWTTSIVAVDL